MNSETIGFVVSYIVIINMIPLVLMWIYVKNDVIKISDNIMNIIFLIFSLVGGFIGVLKGAEMLNYNQDSKLFKRHIPILVFLEVIIVLGILSSSS